MNKYDVIIIGGGPSGSSTGLQLTQNSNLKVAIFEKDKYAGENNICAGGIDKSIFDQLKLPKKLIEKNIGYMDVFSNQKNIARLKTNNVTVKREIFDKYLSERAESKGVDLCLSTRVIDVNKVGSEWEILTDDGKFNSKVVVFADGPSSRIRNKFGLGFKPKLNNASTGGILEVECDNPPPVIEVYGDYDISLMGYGWLFPKSDMLSIGTGILNRYVRRQPIKEALRSVVEKYIKWRYDFGDVIRERYAIVPCGMSEKFYVKNGLLAVGDAAGFVSPLTSAGLLSAIDSGIIAANVIAESLSSSDINKLGNYDERITSTVWYSKYKRQERIMKLLRNSPKLYHLFITGLYGNFSSPFWRLVRRICK